jgi:hypothetical protein
MKTCQNCLQRGGEDRKLSKCGSCGLTFYCSNECQIEHWKIHKNMCKMTAAAKIHSKSLKGLGGRDCQKDYDRWKGKKEPQLIYLAENILRGDLVFTNIVWINLSYHLKLASTFQIEKYTMIKMSAMVTTLIAEPYNVPPMQLNNIKTQMDLVHSQIRSNADAGMSASRLFWFFFNFVDELGNQIMRVSPFGSCGEIPPLCAPKDIIEAMNAGRCPPGFDPRDHC